MIRWFFKYFLGEQGKRYYISFTNHLLPLCCLPANSDVILYHAINVSQLDFTRLKICCIQVYLSLQPVPGFMFEITQEVSLRGSCCLESTSMHGLTANVNFGWDDKVILLLSLQFFFPPRKSYKRMSQLIFTGNINFDSSDFLGKL